MRALAVMAALISLLCQGCGSSSGALPASPPVPVKGKITYRGIPLPKGEITLTPTDGGQPARGTIQPDGAFVLKTFQDDDGALIGVHAVAVTGTDRPLALKKEAHVRVTEGKSDYVIDLK
jgi:hypothetical protein